MKRAFLLSLICLLSLSSVGKSAGNNLSKTEINNKLNNEVITVFYMKSFLSGQSLKFAIKLYDNQTNNGLLEQNKTPNAIKQS